MASPVGDSKKGEISLSTRVSITETGPDIPLERKVAFLSDPHSYPECPARVEARETHMSWVFLVNGYAYKLKKPVQYPYLDYTTLESRRLNCEAEVYLNKRMAPDIYLGVTPLTSDVEGNLALGGTSTVVDWVVRMRRLPDSGNLEHAIATNNVQESDIYALGRFLARFYQRAPQVALSAEQYLSRFKDSIVEVSRDLCRPTFDLDPKRVSEISNGQMFFLDRGQNVLMKRAHDGMIVEGHGDLRPEHIYLGKSPIAIDSLEFDRRFRILDPVDELAYLAMECDRLNAPYIHNWIFSAYESETEDKVPRALILFYKCHHAFVRAKVAIWHLTDHSIRDPDKWIRRCDVYLSMASGYADQLATDVEEQLYQQ